MRQLVLALAVVLPVAAATPTAAAQGELIVSDISVGAGYRSISATVSTTGMSADTALDPSSIVATVGGRTLPTTTVVTAKQTTSTTPHVLVVIDTSGSMQGQPLAEAKQAVSEFVADASPSVKIGLLGFATRPQLLVPPTTDRTRLLGAVAGLQAQGETSLYDAVLTGLRALGRTGDRRLVVLSDGGDTRSTASFEAARDAAGRSGVIVDAIGFNTDEAVSSVLGKLAGSGRGSVRKASSAAELSSALATTVRSQAKTLTVKVLVPEDLRGENDLVLSVATPEGRLTSQASVSLGTASAEVPPPRGWWGTRNAVLGGAGAIAAALLLGSVVLMGGGHRDQRKVHTLLNRYTTTSRTSPPGDSRAASQVVRTAVDLADKVVTKRDLRDQLSLRLDRAAIAMTPAEWLLLRTGIGFGTLLMLGLLGSQVVTAVVLAVGVSTVGPALALRIRGSRRQKAFDEKLPDALQMVSGSLSAGYSLAQALDGLVREGSEPMATEMGRALAESRLGVAIETTLDGVAERMDSRDFRWVVMAIRVQREVGGNLAGVLTTVSATMRERAMLRRHVRGLSAEGRLSSYILIGLPLFLALFMLTLRPEYIRPLYTTGVGVMMIIAASLLLSIGSFWMSRMIKVEV